MYNKIGSVLVLLLTLQFCQAKSAAEEARQMAKAYAECLARYDRFEQESDQKIWNTRPGLELEQMISAADRARDEKKTALERLLRESGQITLSPELELLRSQIMIEVGRWADAERIIDRLSSSPSALAIEAKLQKVLIHLVRQRFADALHLFKEIEPLAKKDDRFFRICLAMARTNPEPGVREEYARKFLDSKELPAALQPFKGQVYAGLAAQAKNDRHPEKARDYFEKSLALTRDPAWRTKLAAELAQIALIDQPAPPLQAETWFNARPQTLALFKGQVVLVGFWAPWCDRCREQMPLLQDEFSPFKNQGFLLMGCMKLYGRFSDGVSKREKINAAEELALIKNFLDKNRIAFPVAVGAEGLDFDAYAVAAIPTLVLIDRRGNVASIQSGADARPRIREQIKSLLAEKP